LRVALTPNVTTQGTLRTRWPFDSLGTTKGDPAIPRNIVPGK
jgi:hypothetical protein